MKRLKNLKMTIFLMAITGIFGISNVYAMDKNPFPNKSTRNYNLQNKIENLRNKVDNLQIVQPVNTTNLNNNLQRGQLSSRINNLRSARQTNIFPANQINTNDNNNQINNNVLDKFRLDLNKNNNTRNITPLNMENLNRNYNNAQNIVPLVDQSQFDNLGSMFRQQKDYKQKYEEQIDLREQENMLWYYKMKQIEETDIEKPENKNIIKQYIKEVKKKLEKDPNNASQMVYVGVCKAIKIKYEELIQQYKNLYEEVKNFWASSYRDDFTKRIDNKEEGVYRYSYIPVLSLLERSRKGAKTIENYLKETEIEIELAKNKNEYFESCYDVFIGQFNKTKRDFDDLKDIFRNNYPFKDFDDLKDIFRNNYPFKD